MVSHGFISQKLKKLQEAESLPFCPTDAAFFLYQCSLHSRGFKRFYNYFHLFSLCRILILFLKILFTVVDFLTMSGTIVERKSEDLPLEKSQKYMLNIFWNRPILQNVHTRINLCFWIRKVTQEKPKISQIKNEPKQIWCPKLLFPENPFEYIWNVRSSFEIWKFDLKLEKF